MKKVIACLAAALIVLGNGYWNAGGEETADTSVTVSAAVSAHWILDDCYKNITCNFDERRNPNNNVSYHNATDISAPTGANVYAPLDGIVEFSGWKDSYGNFVVLWHPEIGLYTFYAHNSQLLVNKGDTVSRGTIISKVGSTGNSTGPHLHFGACDKVENGWPRSWYYDVMKTFSFNSAPASEPDYSDISISNMSTPPLVHTPGKFFPVTGEIISARTIKHVYGGVYHYNTMTPTSIWTEDWPESRNYDLSGKFDHNLIFNNLEEGEYWYIIYVDDGLETKEFAKVYFQVGHVRHLYGDWLLNKSAGCIETGSQTHTCSVCGDTETQEVPSLSHEYSEWVTVSEATCESDGVRKKECIRCHEAETEIIKSAGHNYTSKTVTPTCLEDGWTIHECTICGDTYKDGQTEKKGHSMLDVETASSVIHVCKDCGYKYEELIAAAGDVNEDGIIDMSDLSLLSLKLLDGYEFTETDKATTDVNEDGEINLADLAHLKAYISKVISWIGKK